ncbi:MAG: peptidoglycan-binding protein [Bacteroidales bacterium]|nr:peptidoglycan-binding protein [Bacteroidales bacterium]
MKPIAIAGIISGVLGAGTLAFFKFVKPRLKKRKEKQQAVTDGTKKGTTSSTTTSRGSLYTALSSTQTTQLQTNLNATRQEFLVDEKVGKNGAEAKAFLASFSEDLKIDGKYGDKTKAAVKALQTYLNTKAGANLKTDGLYGKDTETAYENWAKKSPNYTTSKKILSGT